MFLFVCSLTTVKTTAKTAKSPLKRDDLEPGVPVSSHKSEMCEL